MSLSKAILITFLTLLAIVPFGWFAVAVPVPQANRLFRQAPRFLSKNLSEIYPADLVIDIKGGEVKINRSSPYCLIFDKGSRMGIIFDEAAQAQVLLDLPARYTRLCRPEALVGRDFVVFRMDEEDGSPRYELQKIPPELSFQITQEKIRELAEALLPRLTAYGRVSYFLFPFIILPFIMMGLMFKNLWYGFISYAALKGFKVKPNVTYKEAYATTLLLQTALVFLTWIFVPFLFRVFGAARPLWGFPFLGTILITVGAVLLAKREVEKAPPPASVTPITP